MTRTREENASDLQKEQVRKDAMLPLFVVVVGDPTEPDDKDVPGVYLALVDRDLTPEQQAETALDQLHYNVVIACLDDFDIVVFTEEGTLLPRMENYDGGTLLDRGEFGDFVAMENVPERVKSASDARRVEGATTIFKA